VAIENACFLEQAHRSVNRGDRDLGIDRGGALMEHLDIGMVLARRKDLSDDPALVGNPQAAVGAQLFKINRLMQRALRG
jgi:hypothetical protein